MAQEQIKKLNYCSKIIVNEGGEDERRYDSIREYSIVDVPERGCGYNLYIVRNGEENSILNDDGNTLASSSEYDYYHPLFAERGGWHNEKWRNLFVCRTKGKEDEQKTGVVNLQNQIIFPFNHKTLCFSCGSEVIEKNDLVVFEDVVNGETKAGLTKWPTDEVLFRPQWEYVIVRYDSRNTKNSYILCCNNDPDYWDDYRFNIIRLSDLKMLFRKCRYVRASYSPSRKYNVGVVDYERIVVGDYVGVHFEIFDSEGKVLFSKKCYDFDELLYENVVLVQNAGKMSWGSNYTLFIVYKEQGKKKVFQKRFDWTNGSALQAEEEAKAFLENPNIKKILGKKLDNSDTLRNTRR